MTPAEMLAEFHQAFGVHIEPRPTFPPTPVIEQRLELLREECAEVEGAVFGGSLADIAHELADVVYVAYGTALAYGIDLDPVIAEVHRANMTKLDLYGRPVLRGDGKVLKSHLYQPPAVADVLALGEPSLPTSRSGFPAMRGVSAGLLPKSFGAGRRRSRPRRDRGRPAANCRRGSRDLRIGDFRGFEAEDRN